MASQQRIQFDDFSRNVCANRSHSDYQIALATIQRNASTRHLQQRFREQRKELEMEEHMLKLQEEKERKLKEQILEEEAARIHRENIRRQYHEKKIRQQIRENNQELRHLESRLRSAYVLKTLDIQKKEREVLRATEKLIEQKENEELEKAHQLHLEELRKKQEDERIRKAKLREELTQQIISAHQKNQLLYEQFLKEKALLDEIVTRLHEELMMEAERKIKAKERSKKEMEAFKKVKEELERIRQIEIQEENERIKKYCQERDKKIEEEEKRRRELELQRDTLNEKMVKELEELIEKKNQRERLLQELWAFEQNEKIEEKIRSQLEYKLRLRIESRIALEQQLEERRKQREQEEQDEKAFCEKQLQMLAERDKIEQLSNEKRRRKIVEHRKAIQEMLVERKNQRAAALAEEIKLRDILQQEEKQKQKIVEEERIKILQEHAQELIGYFPLDVLRESDRANFPLAITTASKCDNK